MVLSNFGEGIIIISVPAIITIILIVIVIVF